MIVHLHTARSIQADVPRHLAAVEQSMFGLGALDGLPFDPAGRDLLRGALDALSDLAEHLAARVGEQ